MADLEVQVTEADRDAAYSALHAGISLHHDVALKSMERILARHREQSVVALRNSEPDFEGLGDALGALSHKLRMSGFLASEDGHAAYERVVAEFQALSSGKGSCHG